MPIPIPFPQEEDPEEILCSITEQGSYGLGVGEITNKKDQEQIKRLQEQQQKQRRVANSCEAYCMDD